MDPLVVTVKIVKPNGAAWRNFERGLFSRDSRLSIWRNDVAKGDAIVEGADLERVALVTRDREFRDVAIIAAERMNAARRKCLFYRVGL